MILVLTLFLALFKHMLKSEFGQYAMFVLQFDKFVFLGGKVDSLHFVLYWNRVMLFSTLQWKHDKKHH